MNWNRIGFGTWPLSGDKNGIKAYGSTDDEDSKRALLTAFHNGINVYDTADFYGFGHVENLLGEVFHYKRNEIILISKVGIISNEGKQDFSTDHFFKSFTDSLSRLKTNYIDIYMLHNPSLSILEDGRLINLLNVLKKEKLINEIGISLISPEDGIEAINHYNFKIIEVNYNILDHRADEIGLFQLCKEKNVKTIIRTPLAQGILSGKFKFTNDKSDRRQLWIPEKVKHLTNTYKKMLLSLNPNNYTDAQNCLRFCLTNTTINVIIPGMTTDKEVIENIQSIQFPPFTDNENKRIKNIYKMLLTNNTI